MLNDRRKEQKIIEVVQALILAGTALFPKKQIIPSFWIICESGRSLVGTVCCPILGFRARSMSPTFRQRTEEGLK